MTCEALREWGFFYAKRVLKPVGETLDMYVQIDYTMYMVSQQRASQIAETEIDMTNPTYTVTNDEYSNQPVSGTKDELQQQFDEVGWNVKLEEDGNGDLYDVNECNYPTVAELD